MKVIIDGTDYPVPETFTYEELRLVKQATGLRPGELLEAIALADPDAAIGFAIVVLHRAGELRDWRKLLKKDVGSIILDLEQADDEDDEEGDGQSPPDSAAAGGDLEETETEAESAVPSPPQSEKPST